MMDNQIKIMILCGGKFAFPTLQLLGFEKFICAIGIGEGNTFIVENLEKECFKTNLPFQSFPNKKSVEALKNWITEIQPDYIFSISFPFLITTSILSYGKHKFINFHPAQLPEYRGPMPIFHTLRYQETQTAVSVHYIEEKFDTGAIIFSDTVTINSVDTYGDIAVKLSEQTAQSALNMANMLQFSSTIPSAPQNEEDAYYYEKPNKFDTFINWKQMNGSEIIALINACNPWNIGADTTYMGKQIKIISAICAAEIHNENPGVILKINNDSTFNIACAENEQITIELLSTDEGIMTAKKFTTIKKRVGHYFV